MTTYCCIIISSQITNHRVISNSCIGCSSCVIHLKPQNQKQYLQLWFPKHNNQMQYLHFQWLVIQGSLLLHQYSIFTLLLIPTRSEQFQRTLKCLFFASDKSSIELAPLLTVVHESVQIHPFQYLIGASIGVWYCYSSAVIEPLVFTLVILVFPN